MGYIEKRRIISRRYGEGIILKMIWKIRIRYWNNSSEFGEKLKIIREVIKSYPLKYWKILERVKLITDLEWNNRKKRKLGNSILVYSGVAKNESGFWSWNNNAQEVLTQHW